MEIITRTRGEHTFLREEPSPLIATADGLTWWNFAGGRANILLAKIFEHELGGKVSARDYSLTCKETAGQSPAALRLLMEDLHRDDRPNREDANMFAQSAARSRLSKFEPCLTDGLMAKLFGDRVVDATAAKGALASRVASATQVTSE